MGDQVNLFVVGASAGAVLASGFGMHIVVAASIIVGLLNVAIERAHGIHPSEGERSHD